MDYPVPPGTASVPWFQEQIAVAQKNHIAPHLWHKVPAMWQELMLQSYRAEGRAHKFRSEKKS